MVTYLSSGMNLANLTGVAGKFLSFVDLKRGEKMMDAANDNAGLMGLPVNSKTAFTDHKDQPKEKLKKQQVKIVKDFVPMIEQFLEPGEMIVLAARSVSPFNALEQMTTGWSMIYVVKRCILVVTNHRILHLPATWKYKPKNIISQVRYGDLESVKVKGKSLKLLYKSGKKERFSQIRNARKLKSLMEKLDPRKFTPTAVQARHHLCPRCTSPLNAENFICPKCRLEFRNPSRARTLSILLPGGGYFYTRRPVLGVFDALVEAYLLILVLTLLFVGNASQPAEGGFFVVGFLGIILLLEKIVTIYHAQHYIREFIPVEKDFRRMPAQAQA